MYNGDAKKTGHGAGLLFFYLNFELKKKIFFENAFKLNVALQSTLVEKDGIYKNTEKGAEST